MPEFSGTWFNQYGSRLQLDVKPGGLVSGWFRTVADGAISERDFPITGYCSGELLAFSANFGELGSLTSWVGHHDKQDGGALHTLWHMTVRVPHPDRVEDVWRSVWSGADEFHREPPVRASARRHVPSQPLWLAS